MLKRLLASLLWLRIESECRYRGWRSNLSILVLLSSLSSSLSGKSGSGLIISIPLLSQTSFCSAWWLFHRNNSKQHNSLHKLRTPNNTTAINCRGVTFPRTVDHLVGLKSSYQRPPCAPPCLLIWAHVVSQQFYKMWTFNVQWGEWF